MADIDINVKVLVGANWESLGGVEVDSGTAYALKAMMYGDLAGTPTKLQVGPGGAIVSAPVARTQQSSKIGITGLAVNSWYNLTPSFDALAYTRLMGSLESDQWFALFINQGENNPPNGTLKYQTTYYPVISSIHQTDSDFQSETVQVATSAVSTVGTVTATITTSTILPINPRVVTATLEIAGISAQGIARRIREALRADAVIPLYFQVHGSGSYITLTTLDASFNDSALTIALANGTSTGMTPVASSTNSQVGTANHQSETATAVGTITGTGNATVTVASAYLRNSPKVLSVPVTSGDTATVWSDKVRVALNADPDISEVFYFGGTAGNIVMVLIDYVANDPTMNLAFANGTCTGITAAPTSANTTPGVPATLFKYVCGFDQELIHRYAEVYMYVGPSLPQVLQYGLYASTVVR